MLDADIDTESRSLTIDNKDPDLVALGQNHFVPQVAKSVFSNGQCISSSPLTRTTLEKTLLTNTNSDLQYGLELPGSGAYHERQMETHLRPELDGSISPPFFYLHTL